MTDNLHNQENKILDEKQVAKIIGCSVAAIRKKRYNGGGPAYYKLGRLVRYSSIELMNWIESKRRISSSDGGIN